MAEDAAAIREVDPAERYFWLFDQVSPMSVVGYAELDRRIDDGVLRDALAAVQHRHPLLNLRLEAVAGDLRLVPVDGPIPLETREVDPCEWPRLIATELDRRLESSPGPCARCITVNAPGDDRSLVILVTHHALSDGRSAFSLMQELLRVVDGGPEVLPPPYPLPLGLHDRYPPELRSARTTLATVRAIQAEREGLAPLTSFDFQPTPSGRRTELTRLVIEADQLASLRHTAKAAGSSLYGAIAAAVLQSAADLFDDRSSLVLSLASPTDLRTRTTMPLPAEELVLAIGLLTTPYAVPNDGAGLAARITEQVQREVDRGDSHLFYRFARAASFRADDDGLAAFTDWLATTPHNVAVSNVGVLDGAGDPEWVTAMAVLLGPGPNQLGFVVLSTYRGRMMLQVLLDGAKLRSGHSDRILAGIVERTGAHHIDKTAAS